VAKRGSSVTGAAFKPKAILFRLESAQAESKTKMKVNNIELSIFTIW